MLYSKLFLAAAPFVSVAHGWTLSKSYSGSDFFSDWTFITGADTGTAGSVQYVSESTAASDGLAYVNSGGQAIIAIDDTTATSNGGLRNSVRIESTASYSVGTLVIADFAHGPNWPYGGEIDIFETVNNPTNNQMTLHTSGSCSHDPSASETGTSLETSCDSTGSNNDGCGVTDPSSSSAGFASAGGGVFAMAVTTEGVSVWRWDRSSIPTDIKNGGSDTSKFGTPVATWPAASCSSDHFSDLKLVFDITACGDWAGSSAVWAQSSCASSYATCADAAMVASNFEQAYFEVNYVKVYAA
ncbi:hypothetical protein RQP46_004649 [Phenoliferia psychrophenolica]